MRRRVRTSKVKARKSILIFRVDITSKRGEETNQRRITREAGKMERGTTHIVGCIGIEAIFDEDRSESDGKSWFLGKEVKSGVAFGIGGIEMDSLRYEEA